LTSLAASVVDDDRFVLAVMLVAMIGIPRIARRFVPALRPDGAGSNGGAQERAAAV